MPRAVRLAVALPATTASVNPLSSPRSRFMPKATGPSGFWLLTSDFYLIKPSQQGADVADDFFDLFAVVGAGRREFQVALEVFPRSVRPAQTMLRDGALFVIVGRFGKDLDHKIEQCKRLAVAATAKIDAPQIVDHTEQDLAMRDRRQQRIILRHFAA